jgi:hypothetical protein
MREALVGAQVVNPEFLGPGFFVGGGFAVEEEDVGLHALRIENSGGEAEEGVDVGLLKELAAEG